MGKQSPGRVHPSTASLSLQEETSTATRAAQDHFVTHNIPHSAAAYGQDTGMAGFLIGNSNTRNLLFLPSAASPAPQCGPALPSRVRSLHVISQNAASADEPTVFYALIHYARPLVGWVILCAVVLSFALMAPISQAVAIPEHERSVYGRPSRVDGAWGGRVVRWGWGGGGGACLPGFGGGGGAGSGVTGDPDRNPMKYRLFNDICIFHPDIVELQYPSQVAFGTAPVGYSFHSLDFRISVG